MADERNSLFGRIPEIPVALFAFLLNFVWEFWQAPFFRDMTEAMHGAGILACSRAALGDTAIALVAYWGVAFWNSRFWLRRPTVLQISGYIGIGVAITVLLEWSATRWLGRWQYSEQMPLVPVLELGLVPLLQWVIVPPAVLALAARMMK